MFRIECKFVNIGVEKNHHAIFITSLFLIRKFSLYFYRCRRLCSFRKLVKNFQVNFNYYSISKYKCSAVSENQARAPDITRLIPTCAIQFCQKIYEQIMGDRPLLRSVSLMLKFNLLSQNFVQVSFLGTHLSLRYDMKRRKKNLLNANLSAYLSV